MGEIASWQMIRDKTGVGEQSNYCPTYSEITSYNSDFSINGSYSNNELVQLSDISLNVYGWNYYFSSDSYTAYDETYNVHSFNYTIVSYKKQTLNGSEIGSEVSVGLSGSPSTDWLSTENYSTSGIYNYQTVGLSENRVESSRSGYIRYTQNESGKTFDLNISQIPASITYSYQFTVNYPEVSFNALGGSQNIIITSTKNTLINGNPQGATDISFSLSTAPGSGFSATTTSVSALENTSSSSRSATAIYTQSESGNTLSVKLTQAAASISYNYYFSVSPSTLNSDPYANQLNVSVSSYKKLVINGTEQSGTETVGYSGTRISGDFFTVSQNGNIHTEMNNSNSSRSGVARYTQNESGKTADVTVNQDPAEITHDYYLSYSPQEFEFPYSGGTSILHVTSKDDVYVNGEFSYTNNNVKWNGSNGAFSRLDVDSDTEGLITVDENTSTDSRTELLAIVQIGEVGAKGGFITINQLGKPLELEYNIDCYVEVDVPFNYQSYYIYCEFIWDRYVIRNLESPITGGYSQNYEDSFNCVSDTYPYLQSVEVEEVLVINEYGDTEFCQLDFMYDYEDPDNPSVYLRIFQ